MNPRLLAAMLAVIAVATLFFRFWAIDLRPMHGDEANQGVKAGRLIETGEYRYDPHDHHGPTLYYFARISAWLHGESTLAELSVTSLRRVPAVFSVGMIVLLWFFRRELTSAGVVIAALMTLIAAPFSFYGRYFIQESILVCFTLAALVCAWRYANRPGGWSAAGLGLALGLMHATKETFVLAVAATLVAGLAAAWWNGHLPAMRTHVTSPAFHKHFAIGVAAGAIVSMLLFSSFFSHPRGIVDSVATYFNYLGRSGGAGLHKHPWHFYLERLAWFQKQPDMVWTQAFVLFGTLLGLGTALRPSLLPHANATLLRFLALYTLALTAMYSIIPYKTPWSLLSFYHGMILLSGAGYAMLFHCAPGRIGKGVAVLLVMLGLAQLDRQTYQLETRYNAHPANPWVYAHTSTALPRLTEELETIAALHPDGDAMLVRVIQPDGDYWPLPWYLRRMPRVGYWHNIPEDPDAPAIIVPAPIARQLQPLLEDEYVVSTYSLRPSVLRVLFVEKSLWDAYMAEKPPASDN